MGRQEIQSQSHESSESSYFPSSSCYPCGPHLWPAAVQRRSILLFQQQWQLCHQGFNNQNNRVCQCDYSLTFRDQNGNTHGACQRRDNTGRTWCYTTGWSNNCGDLQTSKRYPNNPWS